MISVFYVALFCGVLSLLFGSLPQKKAFGAFRTVCMLAVLAAICLPRGGELPQVQAPEYADDYFAGLSDVGVRAVLAQAEEYLGKDLCGRIEQEFSAVPSVCRVKLDGERLAVSEVEVEFPAAARLVSGYEVKMFVGNLYGRTVKTEVKWNGESVP